MEDKRKKFNVAEFISNEKTPVETRDGRKVVIYNVNRPGLAGFPVCGDIIDSIEDFCFGLWTAEGVNSLLHNESDADLFFSPTRRMTNQELSWWLKACPEEYREWKRKDEITVHCSFAYIEKTAGFECDESILIRSNGGEWREPVVEIENGDD